MTGIVALDVVIGLIFIYLLYSLFASVIMEIIISFFGLRARNLKHAIQRMLEDDSQEEPNNVLKRFSLDSKKKFQRVFPKTNQELLSKFYNEPVIKYLASGRFHSKPSYISKSDFTRALIDILKRESQVDDNKSTMDKISAKLYSKDDKIHTETKRHLKSLFEDSQGDLVKFKYYIGEWFDHTMQRASGWYKKTIQQYLIVIGFFIAAIFNVNTIEVVNILSNDKETRDKMVDLASNYVTENEDLINLVNNDSTDTQKELNTKLDSLLTIQKELNKDIEKANSILGFQPVDRLPVKRGPYLKVHKDTLTLGNKEKIICFKEKTICFLEKKRKNDTIYIVEFPSILLAEKTSNYYYLDKDDKTKKVHAEFNSSAYFLDNFWGYLITALAISLGAPFWFDLLSKLIRIRNSIQDNSQNKTDNTSQASTNIPVTQRVG